MKFFMEKNKDAGDRVTIHIPKKTVHDNILKKLNKISKTTHINGFRKGKIPIKVIQEKYGETVYYDVFKKLMQKFFYEFTNQEKIKIIGLPKYFLDQKQDDKKEYFEYYATYEVYPKVEIKDIKIVKAININVKITDEDIKKKIEELMVQNNKWNKFEGRVKSLDRVTINCNVYEKNKKIDKFDLKNIICIISKNTFLPILNYNIINRFNNDIIFFKKTFNQFHPEKELQNKEIIFKITITNIERQHTIENQESITKIQEEQFKKIYYKNIKDNLNIQIKKMTQTYLDAQIIDQIIKKNSILIPPNLFQEEIKNLYKQQKQKYRTHHHNILEKEYYSDLNSQAKKRLYTKFIIEKIISDNQLRQNEENVQQLIKNISLNYKKPVEIVNLYNKNKNLKNIINNMELENQAMSWIRKNVQIVTKNWTLDQFINYKWEIHEDLFI